jgi:hypothetical protein
MTAQENPGGWPDAPGLPLNPERDGWHWLSQCGVLTALEWTGAYSEDGRMEWHGDVGHSPERMALHFSYRGPCRTPSEVAALVEAALADGAAAERERVKQEIADLKSHVVAFCAPHAVEWARDRGLPAGEIAAVHYDILQKAGARMASFRRATTTQRAGGHDV